MLIRVEELSKHDVGGRADGHVVDGDAMNLFFHIGADREVCEF